MDYYLLGKRIHKIRKEFNISQKDLARILSCSPKHLGNIERGASRPSLEILVDISRVLNVSIEYILSDNISTNKLPSQLELLTRIDEFLETEQKNIQQFRCLLKRTYKKDEPPELLE